MTNSVPASGLGPDWVPGPDGMLFRRGARVILFDEYDQILLARGHDAHQLERTWWFLVGGGIDEGESEVEAAVREVREEAGLTIAPEHLIGPVYKRSAIFDFFYQRVRQDEVFFVSRVSDVGSIDTSGWTDIERQFMDELRWWPLSELRKVRVAVYPEGLADLAAALLPGWDGVLRDLGRDES